MFTNAHHLPPTHTSSNKFAPFNSVQSIQKHTRKFEVRPSNRTAMSNSAQRKKNQRIVKSNHLSVSMTSWSFIAVDVLLSQTSPKTASMHFESILFLKTNQIYQHRPQIAKTNLCVINVKKNPYNGTLQWHPATSTVQTIAPYDGTPRHHVQSAKVLRRPPPLLEVRTPIYSYRLSLSGEKNTPEHLV